MDVLGLLFFTNRDSEDVIFYDDSREDYIRFKTRTNEYVVYTKTKEFYRRVLSEDDYGDRVHEFIRDRTIIHLYLIEKELVI